MVLVAGCLGLRASEVMGLQWQDIDWDELTIMIQRGSVHARVGEVKTITSKKAVPLDPTVATFLLEHRKKSAYSGPTDFIFPSPVNEGKPRWQGTILEDYIKPAAYRAGIGKVGWHTFRHSYETLLNSHGTDLKVQQELMRHANIQTTLNVYAQAVSEKKREAANNIAKSLLRG